VQWLMLIVGCGIICTAGRRHGLPPEAIAATALLYLVYPFTQTVILCEFHGVGLYLLLLPWVYYCLCFRPRAAWLPAVLMLGVREDAFLVLLPILLYFAVTKRSREIGTMAAVALLYGVLAVTCIYPLINGTSLFTARAGHLPGAVIAMPAGKALTRRLWALLVVALPTVFLLWRGWVPILAFVSLPLITAMAGSSRFQYGLKMHYPAAVMVCLVLAVVESLARSRKPEDTTTESKLRAHALFLVVITLGIHLWRGYLPFGPKHKEEYGGPNPRALAMLEATRHMPRAGLLMCSNRQAVFCANRADIDVWEPRYPLPDHTRREPDVALLKVSDLQKERFLPMLTNQTFGITYTNRSYLVLQRNESQSLHRSAPSATVPTGDTHGQGRQSTPSRDSRHRDVVR